MRAVFALWGQRVLVAAEKHLPALTRLRASELLPIVLGRRRIYVLPTRFGLIYALMLFTMLLGALNYNNNAALLLTCLLASADFLSMFGGFRTLDGIRLTGLHIAPCFVGETLRLQLQFAPSSRSRLALRLAIPTGEHAFSLPVDSDGRIELALPASQRGRYVLPRLRLWTDYPLGLFSTWSWLHPQLETIIYPKPETNGPGFPEMSAANGTTRRHHAGDEYATLRDYRPNDPPRLIAWKLSARHDNLLVREHEQTPTNEVVLDWHTLDGLDDEARLSRLTRWVLLAEIAGRPYTLALPQRRLGPALGPAHRHACLAELALW